MDQQPNDAIGEGREQRRRFGFVLLSRAVVVSILLVVTVFFKFNLGGTGFAQAPILMYSVVGGVYLFTALYLLWLRFGRGRFGFHVQVQLLADVLLASFLVYMSGSIESPFTFLYALPVITSANFYPRRGTYLTAALGCLLLGAMFILENQGVLPVDLDGGSLERPAGGKVALLLAFNFVVFFAVAALSGYLGEQLRKTGSALKKTEDSLEQLWALNRDIVLSLRSGLLAMEPGGRVSLLNPVAESIVGVSAETALDKPGTNVFPPLASLLTSVPDGRENPVLHRVEVRYHRPSDGRTIPIGLTLSPLTHPDGTKAGMLVHMQDLTELKEMEATVERAERMAALGGMAAGIAHEIRNPLASISGSVQMLRASRGLEEQERRLMDIVLRETERLNQLITDFLAYARPKEPHRRETSLKKLVEETVEVFLRRTSDHQPQIRQELKDVKAMVDPDQVRQVLWNLLANAADAGGKDCLVTVKVSVEPAGNCGMQALLEVGDNGPGVPEELRVKIFDPFFTTKEEGSGLGLAIVQRIVEAHGGSVQVRSSPGAGSCFIVRLPGVCP